MEDSSAEHFASIRATAADVRRAADIALERAGLTEAELRDQAARNDFEGLHARLAWVVVSGLEPPTEDLAEGEPLGVRSKLRSSGSVIPSDPWPRK